MTNNHLIDAAAVELSGRRAAVLARLRDEPGPASVADIAWRTGLHVNTARLHLDALVAEGLAQRAAEAREVPGRPRILYAPCGPVPGPRSYGLLAEMLTGVIASLEPREGANAANETGQSWGRHLVDRVAATENLDVGEGLSRLVRVLDAIGFQPEVRTGQDISIDFQLRHCPFREVAQRHRDVVCAIHLGLMQGALAETKAPLETLSLDPFVTPTRCVARLRTTAVTPRATTPTDSRKVPNS